VSDYYTGKGDCGLTGTIGKTGVDKSDAIIRAIGDVDELNSCIGVAIAHTDDLKTLELLYSIQNNLFKVGAALASSQADRQPQHKIDDGATADLEKAIAQMDGELPELREFVLPGGSKSAAYLHLARSVARRAERSVVESSRAHKTDPALLGYLNRLSSFLFVAALYANHNEGIGEKHPKY
jgi:cob(I)alamin adenosyltransferase